MFIGAAQSQERIKQAPRAEAKEQSDNPPKADDKAGPKPQPAPETFSGNLAAKASAYKSNEDAHDCSKEGSEFWSIGSRCVKITDSLLVVFTCGLFVATYFLFDATRDLVRGAEQTAQRQLRAYVTVKSIQPMPEVNKTTKEIMTWSLMANLQNTGATPTRDMHLFAVVQYFDSEMPGDFKFADPKPTLGSIIGPRGEIGSARCQIKVEELRKLYEGKGRLYFRVLVTYNDVFAGTPRRETEHCVDVRLIWDPYDQRFVEKGGSPFEMNGHLTHNYAT